MNDLTIFNYGDREVRTVIKNGEPWWVLIDVCDICSLKNPSSVADRLDDDERAKFDLGRSSVTGGGGQTNIINESGLYNVILRSDKPEAKKFKRWVTHDVLPSIRRTGSYSVKQPTEYQRLMAETRIENIKIRKAHELARLSLKYPDTTYAQVLDSYATKELTGEHLLPLPTLPERTYTAEEIGAKLGLTKQMIGILTNKHGLKTNEYGHWFNDKAKGHNKEVQSFRYYPSVIPVLAAIVRQSN